MEKVMEQGPKEREHRSEELTEERTASRRYVQAGKDWERSVERAWAANRLFCRRMLEAEKELEKCQGEAEEWKRAFYLEREVDGLLCKRIGELGEAVKEWESGFHRERAAREMAEWRVKELEKEFAGYQGEEG